MPLYIDDVQLSVYILPPLSKLHTYFASHIVYNRYLNSDVIILQNHTGNQGLIVLCPADMANLSERKNQNTGVQTSADGSMLYMASNL